MHSKITQNILAEIIASFEVCNDRTNAYTINIVT